MLTLYVVVFQRCFQTVPPLAADYIDSNMSMRSLVLPMRICFRVLYLSRPWATFCWCSMSLRVAFVSSFAFARSSLRDCNSYTATIMYYIRLLFNWPNLDVIITEIYQKHTENSVIITV